MLGNYLKLRNKLNLNINNVNSVYFDLNYKAKFNLSFIYFECFFNKLYPVLKNYKYFLDSYFLFINIQYICKIFMNQILNEFDNIFDSFWDWEFRSSNFDVKSFYFFSVWHTSATGISFYDFLLKTKLLKDERQHKLDYDKYLNKKYRKAKNRDRKRLAKFWKKLDEEYF